MKHTLFFVLILCGCSIVHAQSECGVKNQNSAAQPAIYLPADQRHKGLSRYDLIPFTDREKGDPDRYRAVNPNYVKRENGRYYYVLNVKPGTRVYDENLKDKGVLTDLKVEIDLAQRGNVDRRKYAFVKNKGYILTSAIEQKPDDIKSGRWFYFPLKSGEHKLYDGTGIERGTLAADSVKLNYGLQKEIAGEIFYYAFSTKINFKNEIVGASGWIKASAIEKGNDPRFDQTFVKNADADGGERLFYPLRNYRRRSLEKIKTGANGAAIYKFGYAAPNGDFAAYKVLPKIPLTDNVAITDYLKRSDEVVNLGFNPVGVSNDTFRIKGANRPLIFYRSSEKDATVEIDLFIRAIKKRDGEEIVGKALIVYGYVATPNGKRWGWIPLDALKLIAAPAK